MLSLVDDEISGVAEEREQELVQHRLLAPLFFSGDRRETARVEGGKRWPDEWCLMRENCRSSWHRSSFSRSGIERESVERERGRGRDRRRRRRRSPVF